MLEMNRNEFERALADAKTEHQAELTAATKNLNSTISNLQEELKMERAEKASALQQVNELAAPLGVAAPIGDSPRTQHIAQLEDTLANLRLEIERRDEEAAADPSKRSRDGHAGDDADVEDDAVEEIVEEAAVATSA